MSQLTSYCVFLAVYCAPLRKLCASVHTMNDDVRVDAPKVFKSSSRDELRLRILRLLEQHPEMSQREIAHELGVSLGGVN